MDAAPTSRESRTAGRLPGVSLSVVAVALALRLWPSAVEGLAYLPDTFARGEWWRLVGCHLAHWSFEHALWDALTFLLVGSWCEAAGRRRMLAATLACAVVIPPVVLAVQPELSAYAGLSGLDVALSALLLTRVTRERWHDASAPLRAALVVAGGAMVLKLAYEFLAGGLWFVHGYAGDFVPVPLSHLIGGCTGGAVGLLPALPKTGDASDDGPRPRRRTMALGGRAWTIRPSPRAPSARPI